MPQVSKPEDLQEVGSKIRFLRKEKKMSQLELAEAIGVTQNTIYLIETGQSEMKLGKLFSIAEPATAAVWCENTGYTDESSLQRNSEI